MKRQNKRNQKTFKLRLSIISRNFCYKKIMLNTHLTIIYKLFVQRFKYIHSTVTGSCFSFC